MRLLATVGEPVASLGARHGHRLREVWRSARVPFAVWVALARANAEPAHDDDGQAMLGAPPDAG